MNNDGLKNIFLIKSAGYEFSQIDLSNNTLLLGESGVGKTTIMRAVLFFYTMDYSDSLLNINTETKKSFNQWYFKEHNSHIVYHYTKDSNQFLFIVSRGVAKLYYTFVDVTNYSQDFKELFLDQNMPLTLEQLQEKIQEQHLINYVTTNKEKYIYAFHKKDEQNKKIKQETPIDFSLFENISSRQEFAKTLANIFASSKVSSNTIKKSIVSLIDDAHAKINLEEIKIKLNSFLSEKVEIEKLEKKIPTIKKLATTHQNYRENKQEFKKQATILEQIKQNTQIKIEETKLSITKIEEEKTTIDKDFSLKIALLKEKISQTQDTISILKNEIEKLSKKDEEYKTKNIQTLLNEFYKHQEYQTQYKQTQERFQALTSDASNIKQKYEDLQKTFENSLQNSLQESTLQNQEKILNLNQTIQELIESQREKIDTIVLPYKEEKKQLLFQLEQLQESFKTTQISLAKLEHFSFNQEKIDHYQDEIKLFEKELLNVQNEKNQNSFAITKIEESLKNIEISLKDANEKIDKQTYETKEILLKEKENIEKKLDFDSNNLYGFLHQNKIKNKEKILTYLKDEILFSSTPFTTTQVENDKAIFGLEIKFEKDFPDNYHQRKLLENLQVIKEKIKSLNKTSATQKRKLQEEAQLKTKEQNRQRNILYSRKNELEENEKSYIKSIKIATQTLEEVFQNAKEQKKLELVKLQKLYAEQESSIVTIQQNITQVENKIQTTHNDITKIDQEKINQYKQEINSQKEFLVNYHNQLKEKFQKEKENLSIELAQALQAEGIDDTLLQEISQHLQYLEKKLQNIEIHRVDVTVYLAEYKEPIEKLPMQKETLQHHETLYISMKNELKNLKNLAKESLQNFIQQQTTFYETQKTLELFLEQYETKIASQKIAKTIQNNISINKEIVDFIDIENVAKNIIDEIVSLYEKIKSNEMQIKTYVLECLQVIKIDNIFKIEVERDYIDSTLYLKTAKELISYIEKDKLSVFKDISSESFKSSLNYIKKELSNFDDAIYDVESEVINLKNTINKAVNSFQVIDAIKLRFENSNHEILNALKELTSFYDENSDKFLSGLFHSLNNEQTTQKIKDDFSQKISDLVDLLKTSPSSIELENGFVLEFKVTENGNDLKWRQTLNDIGSNGTSTLVKSIINISMLQMVSKNIVRNTNITTHCILDEIGTISTDYFKELKEFVNRSGFVFLNGMPIEDDMLISMYPTIYVGQKSANTSKMILASKVEI